MADLFSGQSAQVTPFKFGVIAVRVVEIDSSPWFVAGDVCAALGISRTDDGVGRLDRDEKGAASIRTPGGDQQMTVINESGLYSLILGSRKPEAKAFKKWVTSEVLPAIRKNGQYVAPSPIEKQAGHQQPGYEANIGSSKIAAVRNEIHRAADRTGMSITAVARELQVLFGFSTCADIKDADFAEVIASLRIMRGDHEQWKKEIDQVMVDLEAGVDAVTQAQVRMVQLGMVPAGVFPHLVPMLGYSYVVPETGRLQGDRDIAAENRQRMSSVPRAYAPRANQKIYPEDVADMIRAKLEGVTHRQLAAQYGVSRARVATILIENGFKTDKAYWDAKEGR